METVMICTCMYGLPSHLIVAVVESFILHSGVIYSPYKPDQCPQQFIKSTQFPPPFWVLRAVYLSFWCVPRRFPYKTTHLLGGNLCACSGQLITNLNVDLFQASYLWFFYLTQWIELWSIQLLNVQGRGIFRISTLNFTKNSGVSQAHLWRGHLCACSCGHPITNLNVDLFQVSHIWFFYGNPLIWTPFHPSIECKVP